MKRMNTVLATIIAILLLFATSGSALASTISGSGAATEEWAFDIETVPTDVFIFLDASGSIGNDAFQEELQLAKSIVESLGEAGLFENSGRIGVIRFGWLTSVVIPLTSSESTLIDDIPLIGFTGGGTCTSCAINLATAEFEAASPPGTNRIIVLITDGWPNSETNSAIAKDAAEAAGVEIFGLGVGPGASGTRMVNYTSAPPEEHVFVVADYSGPGALLEFLIPAVMEPDVNEAPVTDAGPDQIVEQTSVAGTEVLLDGSGSSDPNNDPLAFSWSAEGIEFDDSASPTPNAVFPHGTTVVDLAVSDGIADPVQDTVTITVEDNFAPEIAVDVPAAGVVLQDTVTLEATASDAAGIAGSPF